MRLPQDGAAQRLLLLLLELRLLDEFELLLLDEFDEEFDEELPDELELLFELLLPALNLSGDTLFNTSCAASVSARADPRL